MASELVGVFVYVNGKVVSDKNVGIIYKCRNNWEEPILVPIIRDLSYDGFLNAISEGIYVDSSRVKRMRYRCPQNIDVNGLLSYRSITLNNNQHISLVYVYNDRFSANIAGIELCVEVADEMSTEPISQQFDSVSEVYPLLNSQQFERPGSSSNPIIEGVCDEEPSYVGEFNRVVPERDANEFFAQCEDSDEDPEGLGNDVHGPLHDPPPFMHTIDYEAMGGPEFPEYAGNAPEYEAGGEFEVGMEFPDKKTADHAIRHYNMSRSLMYKVKESSPKTLRCKCLQEGCNWVIRVSYVSDDDTWVVKVYNGPHTCLGLDFSQDHPKLSSDMIAELVKDMVREDVSIKVKVIRATVQRSFGKFCTYRKAWMAKQKAIEMVYGNWYESYAELPSWCRVLHERGAKIEMQTIPSEDEHGLEKPNHRTMHRLFWTFRPCIKGFVHCKPLVQIDGTHLYGKYKGTLLVAVSQDGNQNVVPIAYAIVEGETTEAWSFFLTYLRKHVVKNREVGLISDRHVSIIAAVNQSNGEWTPPKAYPRYCLRHIAANFLREYKKPGLHKLVVSIGK
jgi:hypothetical protein